jgi:tetratricopeptide (TPR) repeat protein
MSFQVEKNTMSLLKLFSGPSPQKLAQKGDALFADGHWGEAKLAYERALYKLEKRSGQGGGGPAEVQLAAKILQAREALAREHQQNAADLVENGCFEEARELLDLAMTVTADDQFRTTLEAQLQALAARQQQAGASPVPDLLSGLEEDEADDQGEGLEPFGEASETEYFFALCSTLPDEVRDAYLNYGEEFKAGYTALNRGDFETAAQSLTRAMTQNPQPESYIPLELATACLNLGQLAEAQALLENFISHHPDALPAYQLLCEIFWDQKAFERVDALLATLPPELGASLAAVRLKGENLYQAGHFEQAASFYQDFLDGFGWQEAVARELAKVYETLQQPCAARALYGELMGRCSSCHARIDPEIKHKYAELSFAAGLREEDILELYLSLAREIPENAAVYFDRISRIYAARGNSLEAERFRAFSARAIAEREKG